MGLSSLVVLVLSLCLLFLSRLVLVNLSERFWPVAVVNVLLVGCVLSFTVLICLGLASPKKKKKTKLMNMNHYK